MGATALGRGAIAPVTVRDSKRVGVGDWPTVTLESGVVKVIVGADEVDKTGGGARDNDTTGEREYEAQEDTEEDAAADSDRDARVDAEGDAAGVYE